MTRILVAGLTMVALMWPASPVHTSFVVGFRLSDRGIQEDDPRWICGAMGDRKCGAGGGDGCTAPSHVRLI